LRAERGRDSWEKKEKKDTRITSIKSMVYNTAKLTNSLNMLNRALISPIKSMVYVNPIKSMSLRRIHGIMGYMYPIPFLASISDAYIWNRPYQTERLDFCLANIQISISSPIHILNFSDPKVRDPGPRGSRARGRGG